MKRRPDSCGKYWRHQYKNLFICSVRWDPSPAHRQYRILIRFCLSKVFYILLFVPFGHVKRFWICVYTIQRAVKVGVFISYFFTASFFFTVYSILLSAEYRLTQRRILSPVPPHSAAVWSSAGSEIPAPAQWSLPNLPQVRNRRRLSAPGSRPSPMPERSSWSAYR